VAYNRVMARRTRREHPRPAAPRSAAARLREAERLFGDFVTLTTIGSIRGAEST
jgi:hypothetical protein